MENAFETWWVVEGSGMSPEAGEDHSQHVKRLCKIAWDNGDYDARRQILNSLVELENQVIK